MLNRVVVLVMLVQNPKKETTKKGGGVGAIAVHRALLLEHGAKSPPQVSSQKNYISRLSTMTHIRGLTTSAMPELPYPANLCNVFALV
jgi:hypothetical protein